jgi:hypothetical protein
VEVVVARDKEADLPITVQLWVVTSVDRCQIAIERGEDVVETLVFITKSKAAFDADDVSAEDGELVKKVTVPLDKRDV